MRILLTLTGQSDNIGSSQLFDSQEHLDSWIAECVENKLLKNVELKNNILTFDGGTGSVETKTADFKNYEETKNEIIDGKQINTRTSVE